MRIPKPPVDELGLSLPPPVRDGAGRFQAAKERQERKVRLLLQTMAAMGISTVERIEIAPTARFLTGGKRSGDRNGEIS